MSVSVHMHVCVCVDGLNSWVLEAARERQLFTSSSSLLELGGKCYKAGLSPEGCPLMVYEHPLVWGTCRASSLRSAGGRHGPGPRTGLADRGDCGQQRALLGHP